MKNTSIYIAIISIALFVSSCEQRIFDELICYNDYQVENKLDTTITIHLVTDDDRVKNVSYTIPASETQSILLSTIIGGRSWTPANYNYITVTYKSHIITDSLLIGNSLRDTQAYKEVSKSTYKRKPFYTLVFSIDSAYIKEHL